MNCHSLEELMKIKNCSFMTAIDLYKKANYNLERVATEVFTILNKEPTSVVITLDFAPFAECYIPKSTLYINGRLEKSFFHYEMCRSYIAKKAEEVGFVYFRLKTKGDDKTL